MGKLSLLLLAGTLLLCCAKKAEVNQDKRSLEYFSQNLKADMQYTTLVSTFGNPDEDKGSGIHIYVYKLSDATQIWIGFTDHIHYARHMDSSGALLRNLI